MVTQIKNLPIKKYGVHYISIMLLLIFSWIPIQEIVYLVPFIFFIFWVVSIFLKGSISKPEVIYLTIYFILFCLGFIISLLNSNNLLHFIFWVVTHSVLLTPLFFLNIKKNYITFIVYNFSKYSIFIASFISFIGFYQYLTGESFRNSGAAGDLVYGTLGGNSHLFAVKLLYSAIFAALMFKYTNKKIYLYCFFIVLTAWLLSSAIHTIVIMVITLIIFFLVFDTRYALKKFAKFFLLFVFMLSIQYSIYPNSVIYLQNKLQINNPTNPNGGFFGKIEFIKRTLVRITNDENFDKSIFGNGVGSYSSRASYILSGEYLKNQKYIPIIKSKIFEKDLYDIWNKEKLEKNRWAHGVANQPFSSWVTILGEQGLIGLGFYSIIFIWLIIKFRREKMNFLNEVAALSLIYLFVALFFDNYLEYPRFMLPVFITVILALVDLRYKPGKSLKNTISF